MQIGRPSRNFQVIIFIILAAAYFLYIQNFVSLYFGQADYFLHHWPLTNNNFGEMEVYDYHILGGTLVRPFYGYIPLEIVLNFFIPDRILVMSLLGIIIAILNGLWAMFALENFSGKKLDPLVKFCIFIIFCFFPQFLLRWRAGHGNFLWGMNFFFLNMWVLSKLHQRKDNIKQKFNTLEYFKILSIFSAASFNFIAQLPHVTQIVFYDFLILVPLYLYYFCRFSPTRYLILSLVFCCGLIGILHFDQIFLAGYTTIGEEYTRAAQRLTGGDFNWYNYYLWHLFDHNLWTNYLPQSPLSKLDNTVESGFLHEHFYVFSLFLIPALILAWPKHKLLLGTYLVAFCLAIILAGGVVLPGFTDPNWINKIPLWHYFRCPARTLILLSILSYFLGIYFLLDISKNKTSSFPWIPQIMILAVLLAVFYLPLDLVNLYAILGLVAFLAAIIFRYFPPKVFKILPPSLRCLLGPEFFALLALTITAACHVITFKGGAYISPTDWPTYTAVRQTVDEELLPQITPGQKVVFDTRQLSLDSNNEIIYNLETIHGYSTPLRRFSYLWAAHINNPAMQSFVQLNPAEPDMSFRMLYQGGRLVAVKDSQWQIAPWPKLAPVRSPRHIHLFSTLAEIATWQKANYHFSDPFFWQQNTSILRQDLQQHALTFLPKTVLKTCTAQLNKLGPTFTHGSQLQIVLEPTSTFPCLLILPYNYSKFLKADTPTAAIFPVDYALIGIYLHQAPPQNQFTILTKFDFRQYIFVKVGIWFILLLIGSGYYLFSARNFLAKKNSFF